MCDRSHCYNSFDGVHAFYHQYMRQHSEMTRWLEQLHSTIPQTPICQSQCTSFNQTSNAPQNQDYRHHQSVPSYKTMDYRSYHHPHPYKYPHSGPVKHDRRYNKMQENNEDFYDENEEYCKEEDVADSDDEIVFNADAFLALRAVKGKNDEDKDSDSFVFVESEEENAEYVELNEFGKLQSKVGRQVHPQTHQDQQNEKEIRLALYGDESNKIAGLETSMQITFDHLCDTHQPHLWPVLPLRL